MNTKESTFSVWAPRVLIAFSIVLLVYFTQRSYRFNGEFDESFLAPDNLALVRGPLAKPEYYKKGAVDYVARPLFATGELDLPLSQKGLITDPTAPVDIKSTTR